MLQHSVVNPEYFVKLLALLPKMLEILSWQQTKGAVFFYKILNTHTHILLPDFPCMCQS